ncbi:uncharacterized protein LOC123257414 [Drosophila ananassae]|uniref:uncharacterized protein LOC123257414 n=1 Tax=Drosophila ananassae TaxID=7217 RepID=UPI001D001798|nr:uncharacterized protein LOC123257414 [Drosophila ananassae]
MSKKLKKRQKLEKKTETIKLKEHFISFDFDAKKVPAFSRQRETWAQSPGLIYNRWMGWVGMGFGSLRMLPVPTRETRLVTCCCRCRLAGSWFLASTRWIPAPTAPIAAA